MNEITNQIVMSSVEICEVLRTNGIAEKEHKNIMRDIDKMMEDIGSNLSTSFEGTYQASSAERSECLKGLFYEMSN